MKAYLIDPVAKTVTEIDHDENLTSILEYDTFEVVSRLVGTGIRDALIVDGDRQDEKFRKERGAFMFKGKDQAIIGKAVYSGHTIDGEMCDPKLPLERMKRLMSFIDT